MTALGVYQQGKLLEAPPIDSSYHKVWPGDKGNSITDVSFNQILRVPTDLSLSEKSFWLNRRPGSASQVCIGLMSCHSATGSPIDEPLLEQEGFYDVFDRILLFADSRRQSVEANRSATEFVYNGFQKQPVHLVKPKLINLQTG